MIVTIVNVSDEFTKNGDAYKKVTCITGDEGRETTKSIFNQLEEKWPLLVEGVTLEFKMEKHGQFWNVADIKKPELKDAQEPAPLLEEHQREVDKASEAFNRDYFDTHKDRDGLPLSVKIRTFCVSYAKDIAVAKMGVGGEEMSALKVLQIAEIFASYIANGVIVEKKGD